MILKSEPGEKKTKKKKKRVLYFLLCAAGSLSRSPPPSFFIAAPSPTLYFSSCLPTILPPLDSFLSFSFHPSSLSFPSVDHRWLFDRYLLLVAIQLINLATPTTRR